MMIRMKAASLFISGMIARELWIMENPTVMNDGCNYVKRLPAEGTR